MVINLLRKNIKETKAHINDYSVKTLSIKGTTFQRIVKTVLWILICFLLFKGAVNTIKGSQTGRIDEKLTAFTKSMDRRLKLEQEASDFAESFVREYLTYKSREDEEHKKRIRSFTASYISDAGLVNLYGDGQCVVLDTWTVKRDWYSDSQINVDVRAKVKYIKVTKTVLSGEENKTVESIEEKLGEIYLRVPIRETEGGYIVEDLPAFIPEPDKPEIKYEKYYGTTADESTAKQIKETLNTFFKAYYEGEAGEIKYFMSDTTKKVKGLNGKFKYNGLNEVMVYLNTSDGSYIAIADLFIEDKDSNQPVKQAFHIELEAKEARYFIKNFDARIGNLKYKEE